MVVISSSLANSAPLLFSSAVKRFITIFIIIYSVGAVILSVNSLLEQLSATANEGNFQSGSQAVVDFPRTR
jgi:hypothetical protein